VVHSASDKRGVGLNDDVIGAAIINYGLLLTKGMKLDLVDSRLLIACLLYLFQMMDIVVGNTNGPDLSNLFCFQESLVSGQSFLGSGQRVMNKEEINIIELELRKRGVNTLDCGFVPVCSRYAFCCCSLVRFRRGS